jgi:hypothetical protein
MAHPTRVVHCQAADICLAFPFAEADAYRTTCFDEGNMDNITLLIIIIAVLVLAGGGWYGRGRWY